MSDRSTGLYGYASSTRASRFFERRALSKFRWALLSVAKARLTLDATWDEVSVRWSFRDRCGRVMFRLSW